jgi:diguanylate cyclase (GGDEF)-like protein
MALIRSLDKRLATLVVSVLLAFALVGGSLTYYLSYTRQLDIALQHQEQIVQTVLAQAEVAAFARNEAIGEGVISGLLANPMIHAVRLTGVAGFQIFDARRDPGSRDLRSHEYPLKSPFNRGQTIGRLVVETDRGVIRSSARRDAFTHTLFHLVQVVLAAALLVFFTRRLISRPVVQLANEVAGVKPGNGSRLAIPPGHAEDEIGQLVSSTNGLIDAAEQALDEVRALATLDSLTGLPNHRHFMTRLHEEHDRLQRLAEPASLAMLDLDHFKQINDSHGHAAGDAVLSHFADLVRAELRKVDVPGRLGGEEFAILMPGTEPAEALALAERLRRNLEHQPVVLDDTTVTVTVSIGIAELRRDDRLPEAALRRADRALYRAKDAGRNRIELEAGPAEPVAGGQ